MSQDLQLSEIWLWDNWSLKTPEGWRLYYLWAPRELHPDARHHRAQIGTAFSSDGQHWGQYQHCFSRGEAGSWDDLAIWSGCTRYLPPEHAPELYADAANAPYWLYYTGRARTTYYEQQIGLARSHDGRHWKRLSEPLLRPDGQLYARDTTLNSRKVFPAFRDPDVFSLSSELCREQGLAPGALGMLFSARDGQKTGPFNACIGFAVSQDGVQWQLRPPLLSPGRYDEMEMAQYFFYQGRHYLLFSCFGQHYAPDWAEQVGRFSGLHLYAAPHFTGPYEALESPQGAGLIWPSESVYAVKAQHEESPGVWLLRGFENHLQAADFVGGLSSTRRLDLSAASAQLRAQAR